MGLRSGPVRSAPQPPLRRRRTRPSPPHLV